MTWSGDTHDAVVAILHVPKFPTDEQLKLNFKKWAKFATRLESHLTSIGDEEEEDLLFAERKIYGEEKLQERLSRSEYTDSWIKESNESYSKMFPTPEDIVCDSKKCVGRDQMKKPYRPRAFPPDDEWTSYRLAGTEIRLCTKCHNEYLHVFHGPDDQLFKAGKVRELIRKDYSDEEEHQKDAKDAMSTSAKRVKTQQVEEEYEDSGMETSDGE